MSDPKQSLRIAWGVLLFVAGFGMFTTIPGRVREIQEAGQYIFGLRFGLYVVSVLLMIGGGKKIYDFTRGSKKNDKES